MYKRCFEKNSSNEKLTEANSLSAAFSSFGEDDSEEITDQEVDVAERLTDIFYANKSAASLQTTVNVLFESAPGVGKTSLIRKWANDMGVNLVLKDARGLDPSDFALPTYTPNSLEVIKRATSEFDALGKANSVLFLDEFNTADERSRSSLLTLISDHYITDSGKYTLDQIEYYKEKGINIITSGQPDDAGLLSAIRRYFPNLVFTIAAQNPVAGSSGLGHELGIQEICRFQVIPLVPNKNSFLNYLKEFEQHMQKVHEEEQDLLEEDPSGQSFLLSIGLDPKKINPGLGRILIQQAKSGQQQQKKNLKYIEKLLKDPRFKFTGVSDIKSPDYNRSGISPRTFTYALMVADGTVPGFINTCKSFMNLDDKQVSLFNKILTQT